MRLIMFSLHDVKANVYLSPFPARSDVDAKRQLSADKDNPELRKTPVGQNPQDFRLMAVAVFDDETGVVVGELPRLVANLEDLLGSTVPS